MGNQKRLNLHDKLVSILGSDQVYFQPPESAKMRYPAIVYSRRSGYNANADNRVYRFNQTYDVTYISRDPDDGFIEKFMSGFSTARYDRHYTSDGLHHDNFFIYDPD